MQCIDLAESGARWDLELPAPRGAEDFEFDQPAFKTLPSQKKPGEGGLPSPLVIKLNLTLLQNSCSDVGRHTSTAPRDPAGRATQQPDTGQGTEDYGPLLELSADLHRAAVGVPVLAQDTRHFSQKAQLRRTVLTRAVSEQAHRMMKRCVQTVAMETASGVKVV